MYMYNGLPDGLVVKNPPANAEGPGSIPGSGRYLVKEWQPTPVVFLGKSQGQRSRRLQSMGSQRVGQYLETKTTAMYN